MFIRDERGSESGLQNEQNENTMVVKLGCAIQCEGIADCTWVSVVEEPSEGELVEPVVVPVDILVALRPARFICNLCLRKEKNSFRSCISFSYMWKI